MSDRFDTPLLIVTGKGGVGKSTIALALGLAGSATGRRTAVCELTSHPRLPRLFGVSPADSGETRLADWLWGVSIDPDEAMREYVLMALKVRPMRDLLFRLRVFNYLAAATPGLRELVTVGKIWELTRRRRRVSGAKPYDLVVVDAPASGHALAMLETPRTFAAITAGGPLHAQAKELDAMLTDPGRCGVVIVASPEEIAVTETVELERRLGELGVPLERVFCNRLRPSRFEPSELEELLGVSATSSDAGFRDAVAAIVSAQRRADAERQQLERLDGSLSTRVERLPFVFAPRLGLDSIRDLAERVA